MNILRKILSCFLGMCMTVCTFAFSGCNSKQEADNMFYLLGNLSKDDGQMMGIVIQTKNKTIVIDGGSQSHAEQLFQFLKEKEKIFRVNSKKPKNWKEKIEMDS